MIRLSRIMLNTLQSGKFLKLEDVFVYGLLAYKANYYPDHTVKGLTLNWFCTCMGLESTNKCRRTVKSRLDKLEELGLIRITRPIHIKNEAFEPYIYEVLVPTKDYDLVDTDFFHFKGLSASAKGLALLLNTIAYKGTNKVNYSDSEICSRIHISRNTYKKYRAELEEAGIFKDSTLSTDFFPITISNKPLKDKVAELKLFTGSQRMQKQLDWFSSTFLGITPSEALNQLGFKVLFKIENGLLNQERVERELKKITV